MATQKQKRTARKNIKKAQARWRGMSHREHALAQPQGRNRKKPGTGGGGKFYRIVIRPKREFKTFRIQDVGAKGHLERLAGRRSSGSWDTESWLVSKKDAYRKGNSLSFSNAKVATAIRKGTNGPIRHVKGDIFKARPRRNVPEREKPTLAMRRAEMRNIKKAQAARRKRN